MPTKDYYKGLGGRGESHKAHTGGQSKFLGDTKGNKDLPPNRYEYPMNGGDYSSGENHAAGAGLGGKFAGGTKGNKDLPPDRSTGYKTGVGAPLKAGGVGGKRTATNLWSKSRLK